MRGWGQRVRRGAPKRRAGGARGWRRTSAIVVKLSEIVIDTRRPHPANARCEHAAWRSAVERVGSARQTRRAEASGGWGSWVATHVSDRRHAVRDRHIHEVKAHVAHALRARGTAIERLGSARQDEARPSVGRVGGAGGWVATHISDRRHAVRDRQRLEGRIFERKLGVREGQGQRVRRGAPKRRAGGAEWRRTSPIVVTLSGIVRDLRFVHEPNAYCGRGQRVKTRRAQASGGWGWVATHLSDRRHAVRDRHRHEVRAQAECGLRAGSARQDEARPSVGRVGLGGDAQVRSSSRCQGSSQTRGPCTY